MKNKIIFALVCIAIVYACTKSTEPDQPVKERRRTIPDSPPKLAFDSVITIRNVKK